MTPTLHQVASGMEEEVGRVVPTGLSQAEPEGSLGPTGFNPSRGESPAIIKVCVGPPCDGADPENCRLCFFVDPDDDDWKATLERERSASAA